MSSFELNKDQLIAATTLVGPVLITAGAGSGKTRVLTERAANAVGADVPPDWTAVGIDQILAITYTEKAAGELAERIRATLRFAGLQSQARRVDGAWISTIHGMCARIVRAEALEAQIDPAFRVLETVETGQLKEQAFEAAVRRVAEKRGRSNLLGLYEFSAVASTVFVLAEELRTRDVVAADLRIETRDTARALAREARDFFGEKSAFFQSCGLDTQAVADHGGACLFTFEALDRLTKTDLNDEQLAEAVWRILQGHPMARTSAGVKDHVVAVKQSRIDLCSRLAGIITRPLAEELVALVEEYSAVFSELKGQAGGLDFSDLQVEARRLLRQPEIAARWRDRFHLAMVDEFQDTDALQLEVVEALAGRNLCTVGDESQSIYRFRGADVEVYRAHNRAMIESGATPVTLSVNYRSHPQILDFANRLFGDPLLFGGHLVILGHGRTEPEPALLPADASRVEVLIAPTQGNAGGDEARAGLASEIAAKVCELRDEGGVSLGDIVILVPAYTHAHVYAGALTAAGAEAVVIGGSRFFEQREVCALRSALRVVVNTRDEAAAAEVMASDLCGLSDDGLLALRDRARGEGVGLWAAHKSALLDEDDRARMDVLARAVSRAADALGRVSLSELILKLVEDCGLDLRMVASGLAGAQAYANVLKFTRLAATFEGSRGTGPAGFLAYLDAKEEFGDHETPASLVGEDTSAVRIMSIHASKGLEFPVVIVPELSSTGRTDRNIARWRVGQDRALAMALPSSWGGERDSELRRPTAFVDMGEQDGTSEDEERKRLFYVACTRARELLVLAGARTVGNSATCSMLNWLVDALGIEIVPDTQGLHDFGGGASAKVRVLPFADPQERDVSPVAASPEDRRGSKEWYARLMQDEPDARAEVETPRRLSYSGVSLYQKCPLRFRAEKILGLGVAAEAAGPASRRGSALHLLLQMAGEDGQLSEERFASVVRHYRLERSDAARVRRNFDVYRSSSVAQEVRAADSVRREAPFALWVGEPGQGFVLDGTIDVYAKQSRHVLIVDYKTGETTRAIEDLAKRYELQAKCYALAAARDEAQKVEAVFLRPEVLVDGQPQTVRFHYSADEALAFAGDLLNVHDRMSEGSYGHLSQWDDHVCGSCPALRQMCPVKASGEARRHSPAGASH